MGKKLTQEEFITRSNEVHNNKYIYDKAIYMGSNNKVIITCPIHGDFEQYARTHLNDGKGCKQCGLIRRTKTIDIFIKEANIKHDNKYTYDNAVYNGALELITITCPKHGNFKQQANSHLQGNGCPLCNGMGRGSYTTEQYISKASIVHDNKYTYENCIYRHSHDIIIVTCPFHGDFLQVASSHLRGCGCSKCNISLGEIKIKSILDEHNIIYEQEYSFDGLHGINNGKLRFDFYLPDYNICIEYDGRQHFEYIEFFHKTIENFRIRQQHDKMKTRYCDNNSIQLIRISNLKDIDNILMAIL